MVESPPAHKEISDFKFKLFTRLKVFSEQEEFKVDRPSKLVAVASKYGIIFVGTPRGIQCIRTEDLSPQDERNSNRNVSSYKRREFCFGSPPTHIDVSCDNEYLAITLFAQECAVLYIYSIQSCSSTDVRKVSEVRLSNTPGVNVSDLQWNPGVPNMIAVAMTDGSAAVIEFKGGSFSINSIPQNSQASCLCWSPKGKQVVIGAKNGSLTQYKPELKAVKTFPPPQLGPSSLSVISVHWLSSFQFIAVYKSATDPSAKSNVVVVNVPKNAATRYVNYEDLCFESDTSRPEHYFIHQQTWNVLILGTTNSMEASILKMEGDNWVQWLQEEGSRPELPLTDNHKDVFNIGIALDTSSTRPIPIGEKMQLGPMPLLLMYAHNGTLCLFHVINTLPDGSPICQAPLPLQDTSGLHLFKAPEESTQPVPIELKESKPPESKIPAEVSPANQAQATPSSSGLGQVSHSEPANSQPNTIQPPQVSSAFVGFAVPSCQPSQQSMGSLVATTFAQPIFSQTSVIRPGFAQPQSFFSPSSIAQPSAGQAGSSPASGQPLIIQPQPQLPKPSFSLSQSAQPQALAQSQTQLQAQVSANQFQQPALVAKPASTTSGSWLPLNFQLPQPQPQSQPSTLSGQTQPAATKTIGTTSAAPLQVTAVTTTPTAASPLQSQDSMLAVTPAQDSVSSEVARELEKAKEMENVIERCHELIAQFSKVMEERQKVIRSITSRTDQNIKKSSIKDKVINDIEMLRKFEANLKDCNYPDQAKVNALGSSLMEMFGWYEKIKARERMTKSSSYIELMESQDLDPVTKNYLKSIDKHVYYLGSQIKQAKLKLGALWDNLETTMDIPVMETIYQSLVAQHNILAAKRALIDSYENKLKKINQNRFQRSSRKKVGNLELSTLADRLLETKLEERDYLNDTSLKQVSNNYIVLLNKIGKSKLSEEKVNGLYEWHKNHKVIKTKVSKNTAIVQSSFLKDHTFNVEISPSKQSTPYVAAHGTPKKAIVSVPRKSLFTLTTLDDEATTLNTSLDVPKSENKINATVDRQEQDKSITVSSSSPVALVSKSGDVNMQNNLITSFSKANEGNKINSIKNLSTTGTEALPTSSSLFNNSSLHSALSKPNDSIPTPASFKSVPQIPKAQVTKSENVISTSWGAQAPVFGSSPFFSSISKTPTTSVSIFSSMGNTLPQSTLAQNVSFAGFVPTSSSNSGQAATGTGSVLQPKANFSFASTNAPQSSFSGSQKSNDTIPSPGNDLNAQSTVTTATLTYIPTPLKSTSQTSSTSFGLPVSSVSTVNFGSLNLSSVVSSSATASVQNTNPPSLSSKSSVSIFAIPASATPSTNTFSVTTNSSASAVSTSSPSSTSLPSSFLALSTTANTPSSSTPIFGNAQQSSSSTISVQPVQSAASIAPSANTTPTSASLKSSSSQPNIGTSVTTTQSSSPIVASQSHTTVQNISPKAAGPNWASGPLFGNGSTNSLFPTTSGSIFGGSSPSVTTAVTLSFASVSTPSTLSFASVTNPSTLSFASVTNPSTLSFASVTNPSTLSFASVTNPSTLSFASVITPSTLSFASATTPATPLFAGALISNSPSTSAATPAVSSSSFTNPSSSTTAPTSSAPSSVPVASSSPMTNIASSTPAVSTSTPTSPAVASTPSTIAATTGSLFSAPVSSVTSATTPSIFGGVATATSTTTASIFGGSTTSIFANSFKSPTTTAQTFFSNTPSFGAVTTSAPIFGNSTTSSSGFGTSTSTPVFGGTPKTTASIFGASTTTPTTSFFGVTTAASPIFGGAPTFGLATTTSNNFGSPTQSNSVFGAVSALSSTSFFSSTTTAGQTFGTQAAASIFGGTSSFGSPATTASSASFFGKPICSPTSTSSSVFGTPGNVFGQATTTTASSIFGGANSFTQKTPFGQAGNVFGQTTASGGSFGSSGGSLFGGTASFSSPTNQQSNIFQSGNAGGNMFGSAPSGGPFSSPQAGQSTFGAPATFQSPQRPFGGSPGFGSAPSFGSAPTFGGSPSFGSSPNKVFGSQPTGAAPAFGSPTQQSSTTFETLAQQDTLSFGNLAQQQNFPATSFAGSSFSSWR